jgi:Tol biopolymer transport system component
MFLQTARRLHSPGWGQHRRAVSTVNVAGGPPQKIIEEAADAFNPYWSPDGNALAFQSKLPGTGPLEENSKEGDGHGPAGS